MTPVDAVAEPLGAVLDSMDVGDILVLSRYGNDRSASEAPSNRFVQFARFEGGLRGESVGAIYLQGVDGLTDQQVERLARLGWHDPDEGGNYWREWSDGQTFGDAASVALRTLAEVHGVQFWEQVDASGSRSATYALATGVLDAGEDPEGSDLDPEEIAEEGVLLFSRSWEDGGMDGDLSLYEFEGAFYGVPDWRSGLDLMGPYADFDAAFDAIAGAYVAASVVDITWPGLSVEEVLDRLTFTEGVPPGLEVNGKAVPADWKLGGASGHTS